MSCFTDVAQEFKTQNKVNWCSFFLFLTWPTYASFIFPLAWTCLKPTLVFTIMLLCSKINGIHSLYDSVSVCFGFSTWCEMDSASLLSTGAFVKEPTVIQVFEKPTDQVCVLMIKLCLYRMYRWKIRKMWYTGPSHHLFLWEGKNLLKQRRDLTNSIHVKKHLPGLFPYWPSLFS